MTKQWQDNPVYRLMQAHGLKVTELAMVTGVGQSAIYAVMNGFAKKVPDEILALAIDFEGDEASEKLVKAYQAYRDGITQRLREKMKQ